MAELTQHVDLKLVAQSPLTIPAVLLKNKYLETKKKEAHEVANVIAQLEQKIVCLERSNEQAKLEIEKMLNGTILRQVSIIEEE